MEDTAMKFDPFSLSEITLFHPLSELPPRLHLLTPYAPYDLAFGEPFYRCTFSGRDLIVFGHDLGGHYAADPDNGTVIYLCMDDEEPQALPANTSLKSFVSCHNLFIEYVKRRAAGEIDADAAAEKLDRLLRQQDAAALESEESFWPMRVYELSEDFFPLDDSRVKLHRQLQDSDR